MPWNVDFPAMLKPKRLVATLSVSALAFAPGCSNEDSVEPPKPVPTVRPGGEPPPPPIPEIARISPPERPSGIIATILQEKEMFSRVRQLAEVLPTLGPDAIPEVRVALQRLEANTGGLELALLARFWALHEPKAATRWVLTESPLGFRLGLTAPVMEEWARVDPVEAELELQGTRLTPNAVTLGLEIGLVRGWFYSETAGLEDYIRSIGSGAGRQRALRFFLRLTIDEYGADAARSWAESLDDADKTFKLSAFRQLAQELGETHLEQAMSFCDANCDHPVLGNGLRGHISQQWAKQDGASAMAWVAASPPGRETDNAVKWAFRGWHSVDRQELFAWLDEIGPEGVEPWMQPMLELVAVNRGRSNPETGFAWAASITDGTTRTRTAVTIATNWHRRDPVAAAAWLETSALSERARGRVQFYGRPRSEVKADESPAPEPVVAPPRKGRGYLADPATEDEIRALEAS